MFCPPFPGPLGANKCICPPSWGANESAAGGKFWDFELKIIKFLIGKRVSCHCECKKFRLRRAQRKHIIVSLPKVYTCFWSVSLSFASHFSGLWRIIFCPPFPGPWGANILLPPIFRDPGGQMKKVVAPLMGGKIYPPEGSFFDY